MSGFMFHSTGGRSPFGTSYVSGSHCGNRDYWAGMGGRYSSSTKIFINNNNSGCCGGNYNIFGAGYGGYYGGGCCGGISDKAALTALGIGAGVGLLASPLGGSIIRGVGKAFGWAGKAIGTAASWTWNKAIKPAATWTWNSVLKPVGKGIWNGIKAVGSGIGEFFTRCWNACTGKGWTK